MRYEVDFREHEGYVAGTFYGDVTEDDLRAARGEMNVHLSSNGCRRLLVDATEVTRMQSAPADFDFTAEHQSALPTGTRHAVLISAEHAERMQFVEDVAQNRHIDLQVFVDRDAALSWLLAD